MQTLAELRKSKGYTQKQLAERLGVDQTAVCHWEKRDVYPRPRVAYQLAELLNCTLDEIYGVNRTE